MAHITSAFQAGVEEEQDPESQGGVVLGRAATGFLTSHGNGALTFLETIRDASDLPNPEYTWWQYAAVDVAHEVGHQFGLDHPEGKYNGKLWLMAGKDQLPPGIGGRDEHLYSPKSIKKIRRIDYTIQD